MGRPLARAFYARPTLVVARELVGARLVHEHPDGVVAGRIVEVEAYIGESDPACHAAAGPTARNAPLYGEAGRAYVYLNYGLHCLLNAVTEADGAPAAVLIRAVEPEEGLDGMRRRRTRKGVPPPDAALCRGPGNLTRAFDITLRHNLGDLTRGPVAIHRGRVPDAEVRWTPRIGLTRGDDRVWRCVLAGSRAVSGTMAWVAGGLAGPRPARAVADRDRRRDAARLGGRDR